MFRKIKILVFMILAVFSTSAGWKVNYEFKYFEDSLNMRMLINSDGIINLGNIPEHILKSYFVSLSHQKIINYFLSKPHQAFTKELSYFSVSGPTARAIITYKTKNWLEVKKRRRRVVSIGIVSEGDDIGPLFKTNGLFAKKIGLSLKRETEIRKIKNKEGCLRSLKKGDIDIAILNSSVSGSEFLESRTYFSTGKVFGGNDVSKVCNLHIFVNFFAPGMICGVYKEHRPELASLINSFLIKEFVDLDSLKNALYQKKIEAGFFPEIWVAEEKDILFIESKEKRLWTEEEYKVLAQKRVYIKAANTAIKKGGVKELYSSFVGRIP